MCVDEFVSLTHTSAPKFVEAGGKIEYELAPSDGRSKKYYIYGRKPNGERIKCVVNNTGTHKTLVNLYAILSFHNNCYPDGRPLVLPSKTPAELEELQRSQESKVA